MYSFVTQFTYYRLVLWKIYFVCKEIGNVEISLVICDKKDLLLGDFVPQAPYRAWAAETGAGVGSVASPTLRTGHAMQNATAL